MTDRQREQRTEQRLARMVAVRELAYEHAVARNPHGISAAVAYADMERVRDLYWSFNNRNRGE